MRRPGVRSPSAPPKISNTNGHLRVAVYVSGRFRARLRQSPILGGKAGFQLWRQAFTAWRHKHATCVGRIWPLKNGSFLRCAAQAEVVTLITRDSNVDGSDATSVLIAPLAPELSRHIQVPARFGCRDFYFFTPFIWERKSMSDSAAGFCEAIEFRVNRQGN
jgi:hypothetical protein